MMFRILVSAAILAAPTSSAYADAGKTAYQRCSACHLPSRAGVPGAFPPLNREPARLAHTTAGRRYLVLAVTHGLSGAINTGGKTYRGVMPAQTLSDAQVAAVLNYLVAADAPKGKQPKEFTEPEVGKFRASGKSMSAAQVAQLRPK